MDADGHVLGHVHASLALNGSRMPGWQLRNKQDHHRLAIGRVSCQFNLQAHIITVRIHWTGRHRTIDRSCGDCLALARGRWHVHRQAASIFLTDR